MIQEALISDLERMGVKQRTVAEAIGVNPTVVHRIFKMKRLLRADEFAIVCKLIGKSMDDYAEFVGER